MTDDPSQPTTLTLYTTDATGTTVQLEAIRQRRYQERFWTMFPSMTEKVAAFDRPPTYFKTLLLALTKLDPVQFRALPATDVSAGAAISLAAAERALSQLASDGVLIANGEKTVRKKLRLSNRLVWMASAEKHSAAPPDPEVMDARGR